MSLIVDLKIGRKDDYMPAKISYKDLNRHVFVAGTTGAGKTALILNWYKQQSLFKTSKILIDPSGSLSKDAFSISGGYYCSVDHPIGLNPLAAPYEPFDVADIIIEAITQVIKVTNPDNIQLTAKMNGALREAVPACITRGRKTLIELRDYIKNMRIPAETKDGIVDRLQVFIQDPRFRRMLCEAEPLDFAKLIEKKESFILDCSGMSEEKMVFLGTIVTQMIKSYLRFSRKDEYKPVVMFVDECHNFINENFFAILKEGRKYNICTILATQDFALMNQKLKHVILSNVGSLVSFKVGSREALDIAREFVTVTPDDLLSLEKFRCAYKSKEEGFCKTYPPPLVKRREIKKPEFKDNFFDLRWFDVHMS